MLRYILNRITYLIPTVILVSMIVFSLMHLIPGDPADAMLGREASEEQKAALRAELGLDQSVPLQYLGWVWGLLRGDFGTSMVYKKPVLELILQKLPPTFLLAVSSVLLSSLIGLVIGTIAGSRQGSVVDISALTAALFWVSIPTFWLGILMVLVFSIYIPIFPSMGYASITENFLECLRFQALPTLTLSAVMLGGVTRVCRSEMIEQLNREYVVTAWAKGMPRRRIVYRHALKNAFIPLMTYIGLQLGYLMGGAVVVESIFSWPGVGRLMMNAIFQRDYPMVQGIVLILAFIFIFVNLLVDIGYSFFNPQIRLGGDRER